LLDGGRLMALGPPGLVLSPDRLRATFGVEGRWLHDPEGGSSVLSLYSV
jgi:iron complex transport system ATP-binding protein